MAIEEFTLQRTNDRPAMFKGEKLRTVVSGNYSEPNKESLARQWFIVTLYRTVSGTHVALVQYRAGSKLGREYPKDIVYVGKDASTLLEKLRDVEAGKVFADGWAGNGDPTFNNGKDYTGQDAAMRAYAKEEWADVLDGVAAALAETAGAEEII